MRSKELNLSLVGVEGNSLLISALLLMIMIAVCVVVAVVVVVGTRSIMLLLLLLSGKVLTGIALVRVLIINSIIVVVVCRGSLLLLLLLMLIMMRRIITIVVIVEGGTASRLNRLLLLLGGGTTVIIKVTGGTTRSTKSEFSSHGGEGSRHLEDFLALFMLLLLEPSTVVGELLKFGKRSCNPDTVDVEEDSLVHGVDEADGVALEHLDEGAAVIVLVELDVRGSMEDVDARAFDEEVGNELDGVEGEIEGELRDEDVTDALALVAFRELLLQFGRGLGVGPRHDVLTDTVVGFTAEDGGLGNSVEEEVGDVLEEVLHSAGGGTESTGSLFTLFFHHFGGGNVIINLLLLLLLD